MAFGMWFAGDHSLKRPPLTRKNTQTLTMREKPNDTATYMRTRGEKPTVSFVVVLAEDSVAPMLATSVPAKAKKRNIVVPTNSPSTATKSEGVLVSIDFKNLASALVARLTIAHSPGHEVGKRQAKYLIRRRRTTIPTIAVSLAYNINAGALSLWL